MRVDPKTITRALLIEDCGHGAYERGRGYFHQGRARVVELQPFSAGVSLLTTNRGSGRRVYDQTIEIQATFYGTSIEGFCSCPVGFNCKHVVAGCLAWQEQASAGAGMVPSGGFEWWLARFTGSNTAEGHEPPEALLYLISGAAHGGDVEVDFAIARRKRDGDWGKGRRVNLSTLATPYSLPRYMQPGDEEIISLLAAGNPYQWGRTGLKGAAGHTALMLMLDSGRAFWGEHRAGPLQPGAERDADISWERIDGGYRLRLGSSGLGRNVPVKPPLYLDSVHHEVGPIRLPTGIDAENLDLIDQAPLVAERDAKAISRMLALRHPELPTPAPVSVTELHASPTPVLKLHLNGEQPLDSRLALSFHYGESDIDGADPAPVVAREQGEGLVHIHRDFPAENIAREQLLGEGMEPLAERPAHFGLSREGRDRQGALADWFDFLETGVPRLRTQGWRIEEAVESTLSLSRAGEIEAEVEDSDNDWFGLRFDLEIDGKKVPLLPLVSQLIGDYRPGELPETLYLDAGAGRYIAVAGKQIEPVLQTIIDLFDKTEGGDSLRLPRVDAPALLDLGETRVKGGESLKKMAQRLRDFDGLREAKVPMTFKGTLRGYQQQGVNWLQFLREYGLAGILADDMGLGKTVQALAHLTIEKRAGRMKRPSLIVAPTSLMGNWRREAAQFAPGLKVLVLHGPDRHARFDMIDAHDLVLTTYPLLPRDREVLLERDYHYLILDEAQQIKNPRAQAAQLVRAIQANHRLCLTGTPMENHLGELWAQFDFLLPGFLDSREAFTRIYRTPIEKQGDAEKLQRLTRRTAPFMLRRTKEVVARELPQKSELLRTIPIEGRQATLYESIRLTMEKRVREAIAHKGLARSHITILDALLKLRQVCCDPRLLPAGTKGGKGAHSAKLAMLMELLPELLDEGRRILLFSQFTTMLGLIETELAKRKIAYSKLTGQTRNRDEAIETFRGGEVNLFLISLKAGGVGLNLTEADTVIHYDPWWNPAVESQATDRAHRIGQDKPVFVYKLLTEGTVEEKILALQEQKRRLADNIYGKGRKEDELPIDADTIKTLLA
ncbi:DEAD/DEAH box helicase [Thiohalomonas denitrificans]|uniref:DEAD/DEAH box helicase n=1 Tax=Thiohalomonas denitrificans TaxID=415747 RepID=UPI0026ED2EF9|nr:DEAD/DEAH box helicase [Thiohalomonas denitrificans]